MISEVLAHRYRVLGALGEGAMGAVWLVEDSKDGRQVALKVISRKVATTEKSILQFKQEFRLMTQLRHPNCCEVYDYGVLEDGEPYFTMEVVPGHGLDELLPLAAADFQAIMAQLALALGYIHQLGFVHRDIKSQNVRVKPDGTVKLMDYGLMEHTGQFGRGIAGTIGYLAPEIIKHEAVDARADLYALGCLGYELLTGRLPFLAARPIEVLRAHMGERPARPSSLRAGLAAEHERLVVALLAKEPIDRPQSARDVLDALGIEPPAGLGGNLLNAPLLGREAELARLESALAATESGQPGGFTLIHGPEGMGTSRLAAELRCRAQLATMPCGQGAFSERGVLPYAAFVAVLRELLPTMRAEVPEALAAAAPVLVRLLPELGGPRAPELDAPAKEKQRLQAAVVELLLALARRRPTVLILEDWQWVDPLGEELLGTLCRAATDVPLWVLLTSRRGEEGDREWVRDLAQIPLGPLGHDDGRRMLAAMLGGSEVADDFVRQVMGLTGGNPHFVERLLDHLVKTGVVRRVERGWDTHVTIPAEQVPRNLEGLLREKLATLGEGARTMASIAALLGSAFDLALLQQVANYAEDELFEALEQLQRQQIFQPTGDGGYRFSHDQYQARLYEDLPADERVFLHGVVVDVLEREVAGSDPAEVPLELVAALATHAIGAGNAVATVRYALVAGRRHLELSALADAERFLAAGLEAARGDARWEAERLGYIQAMADLERIGGQHEASDALYEEAIALAEGQADRPLLARLLTSRAKVAHMRGDLVRAIAWVERALPLAAGAELARARLTGSRALMYQGQLEPALAMARLALEDARASEGSLQVGEALANVGMIEIRMGGAMLADGVAKLHEAVELLDAAGDRIDLANALITLGDAQLACGALADARETFARSRRLNQALGNRSEEAFTVLNLAIVAHEQGRPTEAVELAREAGALGQALAVQIVVGLARAVEAAARVHLAEPGAALAAGTQAWALIRELGTKYIEGLVIPFHIEVLCGLGRADEAAEAGAALRTLVDATGGSEPEGPLEAGMAFVHGQRGDFASGERAAARALEIARASGSRTLEVRALRARAWLALAAGRPADALVPANEALAIARDLGLDWPTADLLGLVGEAELARGEARAHERFEEMAAIAQRIQAPLTAALAEVGLAACAPAAPESAARIAAARAAVEALMAGMDTEARTAFCTRREVKRVLEADLSKVAVVPAARQEAGLRRAPGLDDGLRRML